MWDNIFLRRVVEPNQSRNPWSEKYTRKPRCWLGHLNDCLQSFAPIFSFVFFYTQNNQNMEIGFYLNNLFAAWQAVFSDLPLVFGEAFRSPP